MWSCLTFTICLFLALIKLLRTSLPGELRLASHAPSPGWKAFQLSLLLLQAQLDEAATRLASHEAAVRASHQRNQLASLRAQLNALQQAPPSGPAHIPAPPAADKGTSSLALSRRAGCRCCLPGTTICLLCCAVLACGSLCMCWCGRAVYLNLLNPMSPWLLITVLQQSLYAIRGVCSFRRVLLFGNTFRQVCANTFMCQVLSLLPVSVFFSEGQQLASFLQCWVLVGL